MHQDGHQSILLAEINGHYMHRNHTVSAAQMPTCYTPFSWYNYLVLMPLGITDITQQIDLLEAIINIFPQAYFSLILLQM